MPAKLPYPDEKVTWRMYSSDLDLLRGLSCNVNDVAREVMHSYCERLRLKLAGETKAASMASSSGDRDSL